MAWGNSDILMLHFYGFNSTCSQERASCGELQVQRTQQICSQSTLPAQRPPCTQADWGLVPCVAEVDAAHVELWRPECCSSTRPRGSVSRRDTIQVDAPSDDPCSG